MTDSRRITVSERIIANPGEYKVCVGCGSISIAAAVQCSNCHAYRWDDDPEHVAKQARRLGESEQTSVPPSDML